MWKLRWSTMVTSTGLPIRARAADSPPNPAPTTTTRCIGPWWHRVPAARRRRRGPRPGATGGVAPRRYDPRRPCRSPRGTTRPGGPPRTRRGHDHAHRTSDRTGRRLRARPARRTAGPVRAVDPVAHRPGPPRGRAGPTRQDGRGAGRHRRRGAPPADRRVRPAVVRGAAPELGPVPAAGRHPAGGDPPGGRGRPGPASGGDHPPAGAPGGAARPVRRGRAPPRGGAAEGVHGTDRADAPPDRLPRAARDARPATW